MLTLKFNKDTLFKYVGWLVVSSYVFFQFLIQTTSSLMQKDWTIYFHLTPLSVSALSASFFYTYLLFQIPIGIIYDRFNAKHVLTIASCLLGIGCLLFAYSSTYSIAIFSRMLMGAGAAFGFIGMLKITYNFFTDKQFSIMLGLSESFGTITTMIGTIIVAWLLEHLTWQHMMMAYSLSVFIITLFILLFIRSNKPANTELFSLKPLLRNILKAISNRTVFITGLYGFFMASVMNSFTSLWGVAFLTNAYPINSLHAAKIMSTIFLGLAVGCPINGYLSKRFSQEIRAMKICSVLCALLIGIVIYIKVPVGLLSTLFFAIGLMSAIYVQCFAIVGQSVPSAIQATSMSVTNMLIMSSAPLLQLIIGALLPHTNYQIALSVLPLGMLIAYGLCYGLSLEKNKKPTLHAGY